jgi:hypothetical protein
MPVPRWVRATPIPYRRTERTTMATDRARRSRPVTGVGPPVTRARLSPASTANSAEARPAASWWASETCRSYTGR